MIDTVDDSNYESESIFKVGPWELSRFVNIASVENFTLQKKKLKCGNDRDAKKRTYHILISTYRNIVE